jgi:hypothetical protein
MIRTYLCPEYVVTSLPISIDDALQLRMIDVILLDVALRQEISWDILSRGRGRTD